MLYPKESFYTAAAWFLEDSVFGSGPMQPMSGLHFGRPSAAHSEIKCEIVLSRGGRKLSWSFFHSCFWGCLKYVHASAQGNVLY